MATVLRTPGLARLREVRGALAATLTHAHLPPTLLKLREEHAAAERRLSEQLLALDQCSWQLDRFYDGTFGYLGGRGFGGGVGYPADRSQDRTHAPLPYLTEPEWRTHLALARDLLAKNHLAIGFRDHVAAFIGGVSVQFVRAGDAPGAAVAGPVDADGDGEPEADPWAREAQAAWDEWCEANDWGQGEIDREEECLRRLIGEGNSVLEFFRGDRGEVPQARHVEPELIRTPTSAPDAPGFEWADERDWSWGRLTRPSDAERFLALWVAHPDGAGGRVVRADRFVAAKGNVDRSVKCGLSDFLPVAGLVRKVAQLQENTSHVAQLQAKIAWWEEYAAATEQQVRAPIEANRDYSAIRTGPLGATQGANARRIDVQEFEPGAIVRTEAGRKAQPGPTSSPNGFIVVEGSVMRGVSFRFGLPKSFTGEDGSFAEALANGSPFVRIIDGRQKRQHGFTRAVVRRVLALCEESGRLRPGTSARVKPILTSKPVTIADEEKQVRTDLSLLDKGLADPYKIMKKRGDDPKVLLANLAAFKKKLAEQGGQQPGGGDTPPGAGPQLPPGGPTPTPPGSAGGDGSSPNGPGDPLAGLLGEQVREGAPGPPPRPGLVWKDATHRWVNPETGEEHEPAPAAGGPGPRVLKTPEEIAAWRDSPHFQEWKEALAPDETAALERYAVDSFIGINEGLRKQNKGLVSRYRADIKKLDRAVAKGSVPEDVVVYRGVGANVVANMEAGAVLVDRGFVSTSLSRQAAEFFVSEYGGVLLAIKVPKGTPAACLETIRKDDGQEELILPRGSRFRITKTRDGRVSAVLIPRRPT